MASMPSLDPYKALGVDKSASLTEIRSAHRKLVLKCHPDKVQDESLKAIKQDQFQKVQEAYEILSDEIRRQDYDHRARIIELKKEASRGNQHSGSGLYAFEVKTTDNKWGHHKSTVKVYAYSTPFSKSHEELYRSDRKSTVNKSSNLESGRRRSSTRESVPKKNAQPKKHSMDDEERLRKAEREAKKEKQRAKEKKEKERKRGTEENRARKATAYFEDVSDDDYRPSPPQPPLRHTEKSTRRSKADEEPKIRDENATPASARRASAAEAERSRTTSKEETKADKWIEHQVYAGAYMQAAKEKGALPGEINVAPKIRRAETYATPSTSPYNVRYSTASAPQFSEDNLSRRSTKYKEKKSTDVPSGRKKSKDMGSSPPSHSHESREFFPAEQPSTPLPGRKPSLQKYPNISPYRENPSGTSTHTYTRGSGQIPSMSRSHTYTEPRSRNRKPEVPSESDSDPLVSSSYRRSVKTSYSVDNGRTTTAKTSRHRAEHRSSDQYLYGRSSSPQNYSSNARNPSNNDRHTFTRSSQTEFTPDPDISARTVYPRVAPKVAPGHGVSFNEINYSPSYSYDDVIFSNHVPQTFGSQDYGRTSYNVPRDGKRNSVYAV